MNTLTRFAFFVVAFIAFHVHSNAQSLTDSLQLHLKLNNDALDETSNSLDGTENNITYTTDRFNNPANAANFNGSTSYISIPSSNILKTSFPFSVSAWVKINQLPSQGAYPVFANDESPSQGTYHGAWVSILQSGRVQANYGNGGPAGSQFRYTRESSASLTPGQWYMITAVFNSTADIDIYVDCNSSQGNVSGNSSISMQYSAAAGAIGRRLGNVNSGQSSSIHHFNGAIDQIRFWNRSLTQADITALCNEEDDSEPDTCFADFTFNQAGFDADFFDASQYNGSGTLAYSWAFGDGNSSSVQNPIHTYGASGTYNACLTINDGASCNDTKCDSLTIIDSCKANFTYTTQGFSVGFQNTSLYFVQGVTPSYLWDFGDGNTSTDSAPSHIYGAPGAYTVCLTISDERACSDQYCQDITITDSTNSVGDLSKAEVRVYPNPTEGSLFIDFNDTEVSTIELYAITGEQLLVRNSQEQIEELNLSNFAEGIYLLKVGNETHRIVKQ